MKDAEEYEQACRAERARTMINKARRPYHVDVVRRVESGHVLVLESHDLEELVGEMADMQAEGWRLAGGVQVLAWVPQVQRIYIATFVRGRPGAPMGVEVFSEDE